MKLPHPFIRLPVRFDVDRLRTEVAALPAEAWKRHPADFAGNSSLRLISRNGLENDDVGGPMLPTPWLHACGYVRQLLSSFGVVWSRARLMRLAPGACVPEHADINLHWFRRVRVHIPVVTNPGVRFSCGDEWVHMQAGEAWLFDNWRLHRVDNDSPHERIHLVADTSGSASFWHWALRGASQDRTWPFRPGQDVSLTTERLPADAVLPPGEVDLLVQDLCVEAEATPIDDEPAHRRLARTQAALLGFAQDWRQLWTVFGDSPAGRARFAQTRDALRAAVAEIAEGLRMRANGVALMTVLEARILRHAVEIEASDKPLVESIDAGRGPSIAMRTPLDRPLIVVAAPRSGSTLLFETLACSEQLWTVGGEAHWLIEGDPALRPGASGVPDNRLDERQVTAERIEALRARFIERLRDAQGQPWQAAGALRVLEKTPKNILRIPFLERLFPGARYLLLWRDPRENLASIIDAWASGKFITYPNLPGRSEPWSLLLPPRWDQQRGRSPAEIAAFQWESANRIGLDDLARLPQERWMSLEYVELVADPERLTRRICAFAGIDFDEGLTKRVTSTAPVARHGVSAPAPEKWRRYENEIAAVLPGVENTWTRLRNLRPDLP
ncbi:MAG: sulfotransferase [Panacagrimonas sp.]